MQYTPQQAMVAVGLSQQTLRYWRKVLPPLSNRYGYTACFKFSDLVALKVIHLLTGEAGIAIGTVTAMAQAIFDASENPPPLGSARDAVLTICPRSGRAWRTRRTSDQASGGVEITVPFGRCVEELLVAFQDGGSTAKQYFLPLPLATVRGRKNRA